MEDDAKSERIGLLIYGVSILVAFMVGAVTCSAWADPYLSARGGCIWSSDTENTDELEFGNECGGFVGLEGGKRWDLEGAIGSYAVELGLEGAYRWKDLHGQNKAGRIKHRRKSADGETLHLGSVMASLRACKPIAGGVEICLDGGFGYTHLDALDDTADTAAWQVSAEARYWLGDRFALIAGGRYFKLAFERQLDGNETKADFFGAFAGVQLRDPFRFLESKP